MRSAASASETNGIASAGLTASGLKSRTRISLGLKGWLSQRGVPPLLRDHWRFWVLSTTWNSTAPQALRKEVAAKVAAGRTCIAVE